MEPRSSAPSIQTFLNVYLWLSFAVYWLKVFEIIFIWWISGPISGRYRWGHAVSWEADFSIKASAPLPISKQSPDPWSAWLRFSSQLEPVKYLIPVSNKEKDLDQPKSCSKWGAKPPRRAPPMNPLSLVVQGGTFSQQHMVIVLAQVPLPPHTGSWITVGSPRKCLDSPT